MGNLLTIKEMSLELGIPESTLRYYRDIFPEYLPSTGEGKRKRYFPESIEVFRIIAGGMHKNKTANQIAEELEAKFARFIDLNDDGNRAAAYSSSGEVKETGISTEIAVPVRENETVLALFASQNQAIQQIAATLSVVEQQDSIKDLKQEVSRLQESEERLETQLAEHFTMVDNHLRKFMTEKPVPSPSFFRKIFG